MDNLRLVLWVALGTLVWLCVQAWQADYAPPASAPAAEARAPEVDSSISPAAPAADLPALSDEPPAAAPAPALTESAPSTGFVRVRTDTLELSIDLVGGELRDATLPQYPIAKDQPDVPVQLLNGAPGELFVLRSGLRAAEGQPEPTHRATFTSPQASFELSSDADELVVPLAWSAPNGVSVEKRFRFHRGRYDVDLEYLVRNAGEESYQAASYVQIQRRQKSVERSMFDVDTYSFVGPVVYDGDKYTKLDVEDLAAKSLTQTISNGWVAAIQHHFLAAAVPPRDQAYNYDASFADGVFVLSAIGPLQTVEPGAEGRFSARLFVGPKLQGQLAAVAEGLPLTVDYGALTILAQPLFWLLQQVHTFVGNWGWAIILVTVLIKLAFYKLTETSGRSMAKMRKLQPRIKALQERFGEDRQGLSQAMMELWKREKVNPAAGCLPMLVQIPFFIAFYWVLLESVEMRQAPFALWITDLSARDPFFVLPLLMGAAMFLQQKLNPAPPDPVQAKVMQVLPVMFTVFFAFFPAGLVLYWLTNSVLSIAQQWRINKLVGAD